MNENTPVRKALSGIQDSHNAVTIDSFPNQYNYMMNIEVTQVHSTPLTVYVEYDDLEECYHLQEFSITGNESSPTGEEKITLKPKGNVGRHMVELLETFGPYKVRR